MKIYVMFVIVSLLFVFQAESQTHQDLAKNSQDHNQAIRLAKELKYDSANILFAKASKRYQKNGLIRKQYECLNKIAENLWRAGNFTQSKNESEKILLEYKEPQIERAEAFLNLGIANEYLGEYRASFNCYEDAIIIQKKLPNALPLLSKSYSNIAIAYYYQNQYDSALKYSYKTIEMMPDKSTIQILGVYNNMANIYYRTSNYDSAMTFFKKALIIAQKENHSSVGAVLSNISLIYSDKSEFNLAIEYIQKAIEIYTALDKNHPTLGDLYNNIGIFYQRIEEFDKALKFHSKALKFKEQFYKENHPTIGVTYYNLGIDNFELSNLSVALVQLQKAIEIEEESNTRSDQMAYIYYNLSKVYFKLDLEDSATYYHNKSVSIFKKRHGERYLPLSGVNMLTGDYYYQKKQFDKALSFIQKALISNSLIFNDSSAMKNPSSEDCYIPFYQLKSFHLKSKVLEGMAILDSSDLLLQQAIDCLESSDTLLTKLQLSHHRFQDKVEISNISTQVYLSLAKLNIGLYKSTGLHQYLDKAILYSEKNKSRLLAQNINDNAIKINKYIDEKDLAQEVELSNAISYYESQILSQKITEDTLLLIKYQNLLFNTKYSRDSLLELFKNTYPKYKELEYSNKISSIAGIQSQLLKENQVLVEYFLGDSSLYIFAITKTDYAVEKVKIDSSFSINFRQFQHSLTSPNLTKQTVSDFNQYTSSANYLYERLLAPIDSLIKNKDLIIIPDNKLALIPFEALLTTKSSYKNIDYKTLPYLLKSHNVSYANSATALLNNLKRSKPSKSNSDVLAFAPSFSEPLIALVNPDTVRSTLGPLGWTEKEVMSIASYFSSDNYVGEPATEKTFKQYAADYSVIHIASHALVDDENPMYSKIAFTLDENDTLNDGYLHTFELYNTQLNADMVVLSACNTGYGKVQKGEGVMSLGYAFAYAGVPSVVMSHWQVDDKSTYLLMDKFYKYLAEGMTKSDALRKAKLALLENENIAYANPYYWGAFVAYGDDSPIEAKHNKWVWYIILPFVLFFLSWIYFKKVK